MQFLDKIQSSFAVLTVPWVKQRNKLEKSLLSMFVKIDSLWCQTPFSLTNKHVFGIKSVVV